MNRMAIESNSRIRDNTSVRIDEQAAKKRPTPPVDVQRRLNKEATMHDRLEAARAYPKWVRAITRGFATVAALSLAFGLAGNAIAQDKVVLRAADVHPDGYPTVDAIVNMGKKLEKATNGRLSIKMFPNSVLGDEKAMIEQTEAGAIDIARISLGALGAVVPDVNVFNMPFVFRDEAQMRAVIDGPIGQEILDKITASSVNLVGLGFMDGGTRNLYADKAITKPGDLKGMKFRMMGNPLFIDTMNAMGGTGIGMGFGEVYSALQTHVVDGAENNEPSFLSTNHYQVSKVYTLTGHLIIPEIFVYSKLKFQKLSPSDQTLIRKLSREAQLEQRVLWDKSVAESVVKLKAAGVKFVEVDKKPFYDATAPVRAKYGAPYAALIKRIEATK
jgi:tripartite ATP-independent transporter DctP family solute receptor